MRKICIILTALTLGACAHSGNAETETVSESILTRDCASVEQIEEAAAVRQRNQLEFMALKDRYKDAVAYQERWKTTFSKLDRLMKLALSPAPEEVANGSTENVIRFDIEFVSGTMVLTLQNEQLFEPGKIGLTEEGQNIIQLISSVISKTEQRPISIECKTTATVEKMPKSTSTQIAELSMRRAATIMQTMKNDGISQGVLSAVAPDLRAGEEGIIRGSTIIKIHPSPREFPRFPDSVQ